MNLLLIHPLMVSPSSLQACSTIALQDDLNVEKEDEFLVVLTPQNIMGSCVFTFNETTVLSCLITQVNVHVDI